MTEGRYDDEAFLEILKLVAPGTPLREGLENILKARTGALIVIGDTKEVMELVDGGFYINEEYSPARIYELAKMDGAIVLGKDMKRILYANAELVPDRAIPTQETGKRHRAAERVARQTGEIVISISQRRNIITLYKGTFRYVLKDTSVILTRANQALQTLQKYKSVLDNIMNNLSTLEFRDMVALENVVLCIQRTEMVLRINDEIKRDICELGTEGRLIKMQLEELVGNTEEEGELLVQDYLIHAGKRDTGDVMQEIRRFSSEELIDLAQICRVLGYNNASPVDVNASSKGWRILNRIPRLPMSVIGNLIERFGNLKGILNATIDELDDVEGIGEIRARGIQDGLKHVREQVLFNTRFFR